MSYTNVIIVDNFYENPLEVREFAIKQQFMSCILPRYHTVSFANKDLYNRIQNILYPFAGKIRGFYIPNEEDRDTFGGDRYNGSFILGLGDSIPWYHVDTVGTETQDQNFSGTNTKIFYKNAWAGVLYLTPNPPNDAGTVIAKYKECHSDENMPFNNRYINSKWEIVDKIGNVFNRLVLYRSYRYHKGENNFGVDENDGRLSQLFFFYTEH